MPELIWGGFWETLGRLLGVSDRPPSAARSPPPPTDRPTARPPPPRRPTDRPTARPTDYNYKLPINRFCGPML